MKLHKHGQCRVDTHWDILVRSLLYNKIAAYSLFLFKNIFPFRGFMSKVSIDLFLTRNG